MPENAAATAEAVTSGRTPHPEERKVFFCFKAACWLSILAWLLVLNHASFIIGGLAFGLVWLWQEKKRLLWTRVGRMGVLVFAGVNVVVSYVVVWGVHFYGQCNFCSSQWLYVFQILWVVILGIVNLCTPREAGTAVVAPVVEATGSPEAGEGQP